MRRYEESDHDAIWALHVLGLEQFGANAGRGPWDDDLNNIPSVYLDQRGEFLVGEYEGRVIAMGGLRQLSEEGAEIKRMRVHPDFQRRGFGQAILAELEVRARDLGYTTLYLDTTVQQVPAQRLYLMRGFRDAGRTNLGGLDCILY